MFFVSPGVYVQERDLSDIIPNLSTTIGALVGYSEKGDVDDIQLITIHLSHLDTFRTDMLPSVFVESNSPR